MTAEEAIAYIENYTWSTTRLGLDRTRALLHALGDPQKGLKFVHVAGSNGKGSTCAMLDSILRAAGYRVGLYTSPYVQQFYERIRVDGENISGEELAAVTERVRVHADAMADHPSQFELITAAAMVHFLEKRCDIVVLEVGMGGELDSTNAIDAPEVAVITNIGLEHTEYLGNTLEEIARTKAGIIKPGCSAVCYDGEPAVTEVVRGVCGERGIPFRLAAFSAVEERAHDLCGQTLLWKGRPYALSLLGRHQLYNAAVVLETVEALRERGWSIGEEALRQGLARTEWPARFEVLSFAPLFILDGGHNPQCAGALAENLAEYLPGQKVTVLMGVLADKNYRAMLDLLAPCAASFVCVTPDSPRALPAEALAETVRERLGLEAVPCASIEEGIGAALARGAPVIASGSLYMAGHIRTAFPRYGKPLQRKECLARRRALAEEQRGAYSRDICERLTGLPEVQSAKTILSYMATPDEADLTALHKWAVERGKTMAFPVTGPDGHMEAMVPDGPGCWETDRFGIRAPDPRRSRPVDPAELDLVLAPCVGFDEKLGRLGHGGGYYDRYLARCPGAKKVAAAFEVQRLPRVIRGENDLPVDMVVTEEHIYER